MKHLFYITFITLTIGAFSCKKQLEQTTIEQKLAEFDTIIFNSVFDVHLIQGTENTIKLSGAKKILNAISCNINHNSLTLTNNYKGNWLHPENNKIEVFITVNKIRRIIANETCTIETINALVADVLSLEVFGKLNNANIEMNCDYFLYNNAFPSGGEIILKGTTTDLRIINDALMALDASQLKAKEVYIENSSKGDCKINSEQSITYKISGEGNIILSGQPAVIVEKQGSSNGKLIIE